MASSADKKTNYSRRFFWFAVAIVLTVVGYTFGWNYLGDRLVEQVNANVATINRDGRRASCENAEAKGYPFRIGVFCRSVMFVDARAGVSFRARQFRSAAQVYSPQHVVGELDGPASLEIPGLNALDLNWTSMRSSVRLTTDLPERVSLETQDLVVRRDEANGESLPLLAGAKVFEFHMRPAGADLDLASRFTDLQIGEQPDGATIPIPPLDGVVDVSIADGVRLAASSLASLRGTSGTIRTISLNLDEQTGATVTGPVSIDEDGLVDADLEVTLRNPQAIGRVLADLIPDARREIGMGFSAMSAMGSAPTLPLRISKGEISLGFLSLGSIPPL